MFMGNGEEGYKVIDGKPYLFDNDSNQYLLVKDRTAEFAEIAAGYKKTDRDFEFEELFIEQGKRRHIARDERSTSYDGDVAYGIFFEPTFQHDFTYGTEMSADIICPQLPGYGVTSYLYLTTTNRAAKGCEVLYSYYANDPAESKFRVYDWAENRGFVVTMHRSMLYNIYLHDKIIYGNSYPVIAFRNRTRYNPIMQKWYNEVFLADQTDNTLTKIYEHQYSCSVADQKDSVMGSWATIIETHQGHVDDSEILGFRGTAMRACDSQFQWSSYELLSREQSDERNDGVGFVTIFLDRNHTFGAKAGW